MCVYLIALRYPKCFTGLYLHVVNIFVLKCFGEDMILWRRYAQVTRNQGPDSIQICHLTSIGNHIVEIRLSLDRLISTMGFPILVRRHLYIVSGPGIIRIDCPLPVLHCCIPFYGTNSPDISWGRDYLSMASMVFGAASNGPSTWETKRKLFHSWYFIGLLGPLLLTGLNFNPSMDK